MVNREGGSIHLPGYVSICLSIQLSICIPNSHPSITFIHFMPLALVPPTCHCRHVLHTRGLNSISQPSPTQRSMPHQHLYTGREIYAGVYVIDAHTGAHTQSHARSEACALRHTHIDASTPVERGVQFVQRGHHFVLVHKLRDAGTARQQQRSTSQSMQRDAPRWRCHRCKTNHSWPSKDTRLLAFYTYDAHASIRSSEDEAYADVISTF